MKRLFFILLFTGLSLNAAYYAGYSGSFLRMGTSARSMAMGSGFTAEVSRGFTAYHNPASVAFVSTRQASFSYHGLSMDRRFITSSFTAHLPPTAGLGIAWVSAGVDGIDGRTSAGEATKTLSTSEDAIYMSFEVIHIWNIVEGDSASREARRRITETSRQAGKTHAQAFGKQI